MATKTSSAVELENNIECSSCSSVRCELKSRPSTHAGRLPGLELSLENSVLRNSADCPPCECAVSKTETTGYSTTSSCAINTTIEVNNPPTLCIVCKGKKSEEVMNFGRKLSDGGDAVTENRLAHKKMKLSEWNEKADELDITLVCNCENPSSKSVNAFCSDCNLLACVDCCHSLGVSHELCDIQSVPCEIQHHVGTDVDRVAVSADRCRSMMQSLCVKKNNLSNQIANVDEEICSAVDRLRDLAEQHKQQVSENLALTKQIRMRQIDSLQDDLKQRLSLIDNLNRCTNELTTAGKMHARVNELLKLDVLQTAVDRVNSIQVSFTASTDMLENGNKFNMVGRISDTLNIEDEADVSAVPQLLHVIPRGFAVIGVTLVDDQLFVARWPTQQQLEVYDAETFVFNRPLAVPGLSGRPGGLASCITNKYLYVSDFKNSILYRIGLSDNHKASQLHWPVDRQPTGLSVNAARNVMVTCRGSPLKVQEFTSFGLLVREVCLPSDLVRPMHTIQLDSGWFLTANGGTLPGQFGSRASDLHRICLLNADGSIIGSYGNVCGSGAGLLDEPMHLTATSSGFILAAVKESHRVVVLNPSLTHARDLQLTIAGGLKGPISLCFDEARGRLFVGEGVGGRLLIFDKVIKIGNGLI